MGGTDPGEEVIERWDDVFRAVSAEPRRQLVLALLETQSDEWVELPEAGNPSFAPRDPEQLRTALLHTHLPLLADAGFVVWDRDPFRAARGPAFEEVAVVFDALRARAEDIPPQLVRGCRRLEDARRGQTSRSARELGGEGEE